MMPCVGMRSPLPRLRLLKRRTRSRLQPLDMPLQPGDMPLQLDDIRLQGGDMRSQRDLTPKILWEYHSGKDVSLSPPRYGSRSAFR
ncbi:hypothetical protein H6F75_04640 [Nodosilinea sp. FACHB-131]|uniref:hypothetical protein n=1 Tax=Cyanophyceae TaxID=3028117 RepID=UPI0016885504|nr:hypothetical protein [Nodosilinea sp. FACHB-131]MBD1872760.1 hypothetical protein [Nodosilinea sp. FACHB-131]